MSATNIVQQFGFGVLTMIAAYPILAGLHEACHVAGALLVGLRPRVVRIGRVGPVLFQVMIGSVEWRIYQKFWTGADTLTIGRKGLSRWPWVAFAAAGPIGGMIIGAVLWWPSANVAVRAFALANIIYSYTNFFGKGSDGAAIARWLRPRWTPSAALLETSEPDQ